MATVLNPNAADDEPLRINLEDEPAAADAGEKAVPVAAPAPASAAPAAGIDDLKRQLDETKAQRQQMQQAAQRMQQERDQQAQYANQQAQIATQAQERGILAEEVVNETRLKSVNDQFESVQEAQREAYEKGDYDKVAKMNGQMNRLGGQIAVLEVQQQQLAANRQQYIANQQWQQQQRQNAATQQQRQPAAPTDPVEAFIATRTRVTQDFVRKHRDKIFRADGTLRGTAIDADVRAKDLGFKEDTDEYFRYVEAELTAASDGPRERQVKGTAARPKTAPHTAAPVSRGGAVPGEILSGSEFVMTPHMRVLAEEQGVEPAEWAANYVRLRREGRIDPIE